MEIKIPQTSFIQHGIADFIEIQRTESQFEGELINMASLQTNANASASSNKFIDLFCGIGGFHLALSSLGGECVFASDIDADCRKVYQQNFGIEPHGDITKIDEKDIPAHDVLCGGFPCQSFSKAGNRRGINDPRGTLFFDIVRIVKHHKPKYLLKTI